MTAILPSKRWQHLSASLLLSACLALSSTTVLAQTTPTNPAITGSFAAPVATPLADGKPGFWVAPATIPLSATITAASGNKITEVQFYADSTLIATMTAPAETDGTTYKTSWQSVAANSYTLSVKAKDDKGNTYSSAPVNLNVISNAAPQISFTVSPNSATAPATLILSAKASDTDGSISQVEFYNGTTKLTSQTQPASDGNYRYNWSNVGAGNYSLSAKATDNLGTSTSSAAQSVKVASGQAQLYDIHSDQLGTPRMITDASGQEVWRWDSAPFGETAPNDNPNGKGKFEFNLRFPGQYYDKETGLLYDLSGMYDPATGRYGSAESGSRGGGSPYLFAEDAPTDKSKVVKRNGRAAGPMAGAGAAGAANVGWGYSGSGNSIPSGARDFERMWKENISPLHNRDGAPIEANAQAGMGAAYHLGLKGGSAEFGVGLDTNGRWGIYQKYCVIVGPGAAAGGGANVGFGGGTIGDGWSDSTGVIVMAPGTSWSTEYSDGNGSYSWDPKGKITGRPNISIGSACGVMKCWTKYIWTNK